MCSCEAGTEYPVTVSKEEQLWVSVAKRSETSNCDDAGHRWRDIQIHDSVKKFEVHIKKHLEGRILFWNFLDDVWCGKLKIVNSTPF